MHAYFKNSALNFLTLMCLIDLFKTSKIDQELRGLAA